MDNNLEMIKDRIAHILRAKNLTATQFAEIMQIQPSNVSHILNGRNKPSLDFIVKLKDVFPEYSFDWIIMGKKPITNSEYNLFSTDSNISDADNKSDLNDNIITGRNDSISFEDSSLRSGLYKTEDVNQLSSTKDKLKQIICMYEDNTFEVYNIRK